eukprot:1150349-Pelagomonas_calceolata.AAC.3
MLHASPSHVPSECCGVDACSMARAPRAWMCHASSTGAKRPDQKVTIQCGFYASWFAWLLCIMVCLASMHQGLPGFYASGCAWPLCIRVCLASMHQDTFIQKTKKLYLDTRTQRNMAMLNDDLSEVSKALGMS